MLIRRVRGTRDFLDLSERNYVTEVIKNHLVTHNFHQIQTPILEHTDLFQRTLGAHTDVVSKEMYVFNTEGGESLCLRPEATASTMRAFLEHKDIRTPWRVFSVGSMFRHERPQKGRWREFTQVNLEVIGADSIDYDVMMLGNLDALFSDVLKMKNFVLKLNFLGCTDDRAAYRTKLGEFLDGVKDQMCETCGVRREKNILRVFDCKTESCATLYEKAPILTDHLCTTCDEEWKRLQHGLDVISVNRLVDPHLVRGLDYYNKTVFEFVSPHLGAQDAFCGGGRWNLSEQLGAPHDYPSLGAAIGVDRVLMALEHAEHPLSPPQSPPLHVIIPLGDEQRDLCLLLAQHLLQAGKCTEVQFDRASIGNMMKKANKAGAKYALLVGDQEQTDGTVMVKDMVSGDQKTVKQVEVLDHLN